MVVAELFRIFCSSEVEHGNENTVYLMNWNRGNFVEQLIENRIALGLFSSLGEMDKTTLYFMPKKYLLRSGLI
jgi:hypothetical protein